MGHWDCNWGMFHLAIQNEGLANYNYIIQLGNWVYIHLQQLYRLIQRWIIQGNPDRSLSVRGGNGGLLLSLDT